MGVQRLGFAQSRFATCSTRNGGNQRVPFLLSWNEFPLALVLTNRDAMTLPLLAMQFVSDEGIYWE